MKVKNIKIHQENIKLKNENEILHKKISEMMKQIEKFESVITNQKSKEENIQEPIAIIDNDGLMNFKDNNNVEIMLVNEYIAKKDAVRRQFKRVLVYKRNIQISKLRKIKQLSESTAIFFETREEITNYINAMEEKDENRCN